MFNFTKQFLWIFLIFVFALNFGCGSSFTYDEKESNGNFFTTGSISLNLLMPGSRILTPEFDLNPTSFDISGSGPDSQSFTW